MIEKEFVKSFCISCGKETPVVFIVKDLTNYPLYRIPLCRDCSNAFAEDVISSLRKKLDIKKTDNINLKKKVKKMNIVSHNHKEIITQFHKKEQKENDIKC